MKRSYRLDTANVWNAIARLAKRFGPPRYDEELAIYFGESDYFKVLITREGLTYSWRPPTATPDPFHRAQHFVRTDLRNLKDKLLLLKDLRGNSVWISTTPLFYFVSGEERIEIRLQSLIGPLLSVRAPGLPEAQAEAFVKRTRRLTREYLVPNLQEAIAAISDPPSELLRGSTNILPPKIVDYCKRNGLPSPTKRITTYRELLRDKSNDYSNLEVLFRSLKSTELLSNDKPYAGPLQTTVSVIIPYYNASGTITRTLDALAQQRLPRQYLFEVIVVSDGSPEPLPSLQDYPFVVKTIHLSSNTGASHAREVGVLHSSGDVLIFLDADILITPHYISDHCIRNEVLDNAVFVSFKENVSPTDERVTPAAVRQGLSMPDFSHDLRIHKHVAVDAIGSYRVHNSADVTILEDTNYFKDFHGARVFGVYDLSCMVVGHNFSTTRQVLHRSSPFSRAFRGWGMEDVFFGLRVIASGAFIIPVLSSAVYHLDHPPRSGSERRKRQEYKRNTECMNTVLDTQLPQA